MCLTLCWGKNFLFKEFWLIITIWNLWKLGLKIWHWNAFLYLDPDFVKENEYSVSAQYTHRKLSEIRKSTSHILLCIEDIVEIESLQIANLSGYLENLAGCLCVKVDCWSSVEVTIIIVCDYLINIILFLCTWKKDVGLSFESKPL